MHPTPGKNPSPNRGGEILPPVESDFSAEQHKKGLTTCASSTKIKLITASEKVDKLLFIDYATVGAAISCPRGTSQK